MLAKRLSGVNGKCVLVCSVVCIKLENYWSRFAKLTASQRHAEFHWYVTR
jgi:hypothetical protein